MGVVLVLVLLLVVVEGTSLRAMQKFFLLLQFHLSSLTQSFLWGGIPGFLLN